MRKSLQILSLLILINSEVFSQNSCNPPTFQLTPTTKNKTIEWSKFPEFSLPFKIIYGGPRFDDAQKSPLKRGFSHLNTLNSFDNGLGYQNLATLWYGVGYVDGKQPWETIRSPWNNDMALYERKWKEFINSGINSEILVLDIERMFYSNNEILQLKNHATTPQEIKNLDNQSFISRYKQDIQKIYAQSFSFAKNNGIAQGVKFGSYADSPIYSSFVSIASNTWQKWTTDPALLNYINLDFTKNTVGGAFYKHQDYVMPSTYAYYDYPNVLAGDYLPYLLFMIEANRAWTSKPIVPFVWLRFDAPDRDNHEKFIKPYMAEASAIFPFMAGASGLWLWDNPMLFNKDENFSTYEHFINGLYRLSLYKDMFDGTQSYVMPTPANEYTDTRKPVWRGVAKGNQLLVAAHNPYAKSETEVVNLEISYKSWKNTITLKGYETYLCKFDLSLLATENQEVTSKIMIFPNPALEEINLTFHSSRKEILPIEIIDLQGKIHFIDNVESIIGENAKTLKINQLSTGNYLLKLGNSKPQKLNVVR